MRLEKNLLSLVLALAMVITMVPLFSVEAYAYTPISQATVSYQSPIYNTSGNAKSGLKGWETKDVSNYELVTSSTSASVTWGINGQESWYVVSGTGINLSGGVKVNGNVHLILADSCSVKITVPTTDSEAENAGIKVYEGNSLTIYGQSAGNQMGCIEVTGTSASGGWYGGAGIGGSNFCSNGAITINGGTVTATGGTNGAGIGGGNGGNGTNITINGGIVKATGHYHGAGIGGGTNGSGSNIIINDGTVTATGGNDDAGIGGGTNGSGSNIIINGGTVAATSLNWGAGIGGGNSGKGSYIDIKGGTVTATGGLYGGAGIGNGSGCGTSATAIKVNKELILKAGDSSNTVTTVTHTSTEDIAKRAEFTKRYVTIIPSICINTSTGALYTSAQGIQLALNEATIGQTIQLTADVDIDAAISIAASTTKALDLNGYVLNGNGKQVISNSGNLSIIDTNSGNQTHYYTVNSDGLWVWDDSKTADAVSVDSLTAKPAEGTVIAIPGGAITGGVNIYANIIINSKTLTIDRCAIVGNTAKRGAVIYNYGNTLNLSNCLIAGNCAFGVQNCANCTLSIVGSSIIANNDKGVHNAGHCIVSGIVTIDCNTQSSGIVKSNLYCDGAENYVSINSLTSSSKIGVSTSIDPTSAAAVKFASGSSIDYAKNYFFSDNDAYEVATTTGGLMLQVKSASPTPSPTPNPDDGGGSSSNTVTISVSGDKDSAEEQDESSYKTCKHDDSCELSKFPDVDIDDWYHDGMHFCIENGYINGTNRGLLQPNADITRAQVCMILWNIEGKPVVDYVMNFSDVKETDWFIEAVRWAASEGIVSGHKGLYEGQFWPETAITREQLAQVLYNYAKTKNMGFAGSWMFLISNSDANQISGWAGEAMHWTVMKQITSGDAFGLLKPQSNATRAEAATMILRFCEALVE